MSQVIKPFKTVFIIAADVLGDNSIEPMAVYYRGIVQKYEMTFNRTGGPAQRSQGIRHKGQSRSLSPNARTALQLSNTREAGAVLYRQIVR